jgi:hypothetical protein
MLKDMNIDRSHFRVAFDIFNLVSKLIHLGRSLVGEQKTRKNSETFLLAI